MEMTGRRERKFLDLHHYSFPVFSNYFSFLVFNLVMMIIVAMVGFFIFYYVS